MQEPFHEPLAAMDRQFLAMEGPGAPMHVSGVGVYELGPLRSETGGVDVEAYRKVIEATLDRIPRYRQRLAWTPLERRPVWIDDARFDLGYHVRHTALPAPGDEEQLKRHTARIVEQPLDRSRPLWEMWVVEGLESGECFAVVTKMHHCMIDGGSGVGLMGLLLSPSPEVKRRAPKPWSPRPQPSALVLGAGDLRRRLETPARLLRGARGLLGDASGLPALLRQRADALGEMLVHALPGSKTPLNGELGPHRRVDWLEMPLDDAKALRRVLDCSLNDLVLAVVTGALRRTLRRRGARPEGLDFRASTPVDVRREDERGRMGNRTSSWILPLPLHERAPLDQLDAIVRRTRALKGANQAVAVEMVMTVAEEVPGLLSVLAGAVRGQVNTIVTNIPGPPVPLYLMGCRALRMQPLVQLVPGVGLATAVLSYAGVLHWGFTADDELVPDLRDFREDVAAAFAALREAAGPGAAPRTAGEAAGC